MYPQDPYLIRSVADLPESRRAHSVDSNCACSDSDSYLHVENQVTLVQNLRKAALHTAPLTDQMFLAFNPLADGGPVVLNQAAWQLLNHFDSTKNYQLELSTSTQDAVARLHKLGLLEAVDLQPQFKRGRDQTLVAWLHTTNACNLRCTYCYIDKSDEPMAEETGYAAIDAIFRSAQQHGYPKVKLKYAGGESTLNFGLVMQLHAYAEELAGQTGIAVRHVILSNGVTLTRPMLAYIKEHGITLSLSLDGLGDSHDDQRVFANGRSSATIVARSIDRAIQQGVKTHLSITVTSRNANAVAEAVKFALDRGLLFNLNFFRENEVAQDHADLRAEDEALIVVIRQTFQVIEENLPQHSLLSSLVDRANFAAVHETACGAGHSYMVVDQHGQVARCQMEIEQAVSNVFAADPLSEIRLYDKGFQHTSVEEKEGCRECSWRYWCAGGCPALTYRATGRNDVKSPYCNVYKAIYPELLRLEGLRLLEIMN